MNYLITGCSGFIGAALCQKLLQSPNNHIIGIDNMNDYYDVNLKKFRLAPLKASPNFTFYQLNVADKPSLFRIFQEHNPDYIIHLAAQAGVRYSIDHPDIYITSNIVGFYNIIEICRHFPIKHLIYASSSSVYGDNSKIPYSTDDKADSPVSLYAATKKSDELLAYAYSKLYDLPCTGLRFFTVYGPAGRPDMAYYKFTNKLINGESIQIYNYGKCKRDFTYIDDIIEGLIRVIPSPPAHDSSTPPYRIYNLGHGSPVDLHEFITILQSELQQAGLLPDDYDSISHQELLPMQAGDVAITYADTSSFEKDFNYKPSTDLRTGLNNFVKWYKQYNKETL